MWEVGNQIRDHVELAVYLHPKGEMPKYRTYLTAFQAFTTSSGDVSIEAILPNGTTQILSYVDHFSFNWINNYIYADDAAPVLPQGTIIHVAAWHDNTSRNPNNPDPDQWIGWGDRTVDEMAHAWVNVTYITEDDYKEWAANHHPARPASP